MLIDDWNKKAVQALQTDADRALGLTELDDVAGNKEAVEDMIANAHRNYIDLARRSRPLIMSDADMITFQRKMDRLRACLHFFGVSL